MSTTTGMPGCAVSLLESGLLVNGMTVTDLLSGFSVRADSVVSVDDFSGAPTGHEGPMWRGSSVPIARLEAIRELIAEAMDARAQDPELTSSNPRVPRTRFPWGVGEKRSDVVVIGQDARLTAAYLRSVGVRARCVDLDASLRIAADLEVARAELVELEGQCAEPDRRDTEPIRQHLSRSLLQLRGLVDRQRGGLTLLIIGVIVASAVITSVVSRRGDSPTVAGLVTEHAGGEGERFSDVEHSSAPTEMPITDAVAPPWQDPQRRGSIAGGAGLPALRAATPVNARAEGWTLVDATERREIWASEDSGVRLLVAATPTPLTSQDDLDVTVLAALKEHPQVKVISFAPVDYEDEAPGSVTRWQIRLIDGHQVSVGCQYRWGSQELMNQRLAACDRFTATARVG